MLAASEVERSETLGVLDETAMSESSDSKEGARVGWVSADLATRGSGGRSAGWFGQGLDALHRAEGEVQVPTEETETEE